MNQTSIQTTEEINWIPLKDAARMLGCSVKTIRRRIKGGAWRSMIEYQGQKAIRLVAREDVLRESSALDRLPADSPEASLALQALDGLPIQLGEVLKSYLSRLGAETIRSSRKFRIYIVLAVVGSAVLFGGGGYYLSRRQERELEGRIDALSRTLSTTFSRGQAGLARDLSLVAKRTEEGRRLAEEAGRRSEIQGRDLEALLGYLKSLEEDSRESRGEAAGIREEIRYLRREVERLGQALRPEEEAEVEPGDEPGAGDAQPAPPKPEPDAGGSREKKSSGFLGIF